MKHFKRYNRIIATKEKAAGNESVGSMWAETKSFPIDTPVSEIIDWASDADGRLILTIDETEAEDDFDF